MSGSCGLIKDLINLTKCLRVPYFTKAWQKAYHEAADPPPGSSRGFRCGEGECVSQREKPELLAPAGNLESALTAYKYGADAVYAGLGRFNAREMGENFSFDDMSRLSAYAKKTGRRFYLTLNTLVKETEIQDLFAFLDRVEPLEPDALILQDIGVVRLLKEFYPQWELHGSTQMGIHNSAGVAAAAEMGLSRVILERQVSLKELQLITSRSPLEIEVFVHGALCCGLSGHCLFSSWIGGWSGNRGRCKQPCRRRYHTAGEGEKQSGFFFSPQDLYTLDMLGELKAAGAVSFKIEGRLKNPDYVRNVVTAYRMVLDAPADQEKAVLGEARNILTGSFGRRWSHGFYIEEERDSLIQYDSLGVSGQFLGHVTAVKESGFSVKLGKRLYLGDRLRIQPKSGDEGPALTVTRLSRGSSPVKMGTQGETVFVHCDKEVPSGGLVYKIGVSRRDDLPDLASLPLHTPPRLVNLKLELTENGMTAAVTGLGPDAPVIETRWPGTPEKAGKRPLEASRLEELFRASRDPLLRAGRIDVTVRGDWFIPLSEQKARRREFWDSVTALLPPAQPPQGQPGEVRLARYQSLKEEWKAAGTGSAGELRRIVLARGGQISDEVKGDRVFSVEYDRWRREGIRLAGDEEISLPHFCPEGELSALTQGIRDLWEKGIRRFRVTSLYQLPLLTGGYSGGSLELTAAYPLPVTNAAASHWLGSRGCSRVQGWIELEEGGLKALIGSSAVAVEVYQRGLPFLLATRAAVAVEGPITDSRGTGFRVETSSDGNLHYVYPREFLELPLSFFHQDTDLYREGGEDRGTSLFNFDKAFV